MPNAKPLKSKNPSPPGKAEAAGNRWQIAWMPRASQPQRRQPLRTQALRARPPKATGLTSTARATALPPRAWDHLRLSVRTPAVPGAHGRYSPVGDTILLHHDARGRTGPPTTQATMLSGLFQNRPRGSCGHWSTHPGGDDQSRGLLPGALDRRGRE